MSTDKAYFSTLAALQRGKTSVASDHQGQPLPSPARPAHDDAAVQKAAKREKNLRRIEARYGVFGQKAEEIYDFERKCKKRRLKDNPDMSKEAAKTFARQDTCMKYGHLIRQKHPVAAFE